MWEIMMRRKVTRDSYAPVDDVAQEIHGKLSNNDELPPGKRILGEPDSERCSQADVYDRRLAYYHSRGRALFGKR